MSSAQPRTSREFLPIPALSSFGYLRGTPLGPLHAKARVDRVEGVKTFAIGHLADAQGITVEAEGVFIHPRES